VESKFFVTHQDAVAQAGGAEVEARTVPVDRKIIILTNVRKQTIFVRDSRIHGNQIGGKTIHHQIIAKVGGKVIAGEQGKNVTNARKDGHTTIVKRRVAHDALIPAKKSVRRNMRNDNAIPPTRIQRVFVWEDGRTATNFGEAAISKAPMKIASQAAQNLDLEDI